MKTAGLMEWEADTWSRMASLRLHYFLHFLKDSGCIPGSKQCWLMDAGGKAHSAVEDQSTCPVASDRQKVDRDDSTVVITSLSLAPTNPVSSHYSLAILKCHINGITDHVTI
jgi:hypothetical protein